MQRLSKTMNKFVKKNRNVCTGDAIVVNVGGQIKNKKNKLKNNNWLFQRAV